MTPPHDGQQHRCVDAETCRDIAIDKAGIAVGAHERNFDHGVGRLERRFETAEQHNEDRMNRIANVQMDHGKAIEGFLSERRFKQYTMFMTRARSFSQGNMVGNFYGRSG